jgi:hypothetical protein
MTVGEKLSQGAAQVQDAWTSLSDVWMQTAHDLVGSAAADPFGLLHPDVVMEQVFDFTLRAVELNWDLISALTGTTVGAEYGVIRGATTATDAVSTEIVMPTEVVAPAIEETPSIEPPRPEPVRSREKPTGPVAAGRYGRVSKAELQKALSGRNLPESGTVKELRARLIEADQKTPH